ncbi:MAG: TVP38/TMEM64 family protein, partial [Planctomycetes bacterium]|nr:TVP38/TMEM64 family protein [Planctomycetota bacterium]
MGAPGVRGALRGERPAPRARRRADAGGRRAVRAGRRDGRRLGASTIAATAAFLLARTAARAAVERAARRHPRFAAVDEAVGEGGWRVVALLRLAPVVPFVALNYLLGLTPVRLGPYVLASWAAMLPATVVYVALGHLGRAGLEGPRTPAEWGLLA